MKRLLHERLRDVLPQLLIAEPQASGIDYGRDSISNGKGGHGKHGTTSAAPPHVDALAVEWAEFFARALDMAELDLARAKGTAPRPEPAPKQGRVAAGVANRRKRRIVESVVYRGRPPEFVAYVEGCSADLVRKTRAARNLDTHGLPLPRVRPLTAPPGAALQDFETTHTQETE